MRVLILGVTGFAGTYLARELVRAGGEVYGAARERSGGGFSKEVSVGGRAVPMVPCDVTDPVRAGEALDEAAAAHGGARILVNCAGVGVAGRILGRDGPMPLEDFANVIQVNLIGTFNMMRLAAARMAALEPLDDGSRGVIVNTASVAATDGQIGQSAYAASKGGIVSLALPAAREFARIGVRVNTIAPGIFYTPLLANIPEEARGRLAESIPYPSRLGEPDEFADAVLFAIRNAYLNAEVIRLDGAIRLPPK